MVIPYHHRRTDENYNQNYPNKQHCLDNDFKVEKLYVWEPLRLIKDTNGLAIRVSQVAIMLVGLGANNNTQKGARDLALSPFLFH